MSAPLRLFAAVALFATPALAAADVPPVVDAFGRLHFLLLHFPIALLLAVLAVELLLKKRIADDKRRDVVALLLLVAAGGAVLSVATGLAHASTEEFFGHAGALLAQHRNTGIATAVLTVLTLVAHRMEAGKKAFLPLLAMACVSVVFVGHRGGQLVHGDTYLTAPFRDKEKKTDEDKPERVVASDGDEGGPAEERARHPEGVAIAEPTYDKHIAPLFERSCFKCHGAEKRKGGLRLDRKRFALKGGETGPAIVPGDVGESLMIKYITLPSDDEDVMPTKGKLLAQSEIETLKNWVKAGAPGMPD